MRIAPLRRLLYAVCEVRGGDENDIDIGLDTERVDMFRCINLILMWKSKNKKSDRYSI